MFPTAAASLLRASSLRVLALIGSLILPPLGVAAEGNIPFVEVDFKSLLATPHPATDIPPGDRSLLPLHLPTELHNNCDLKLSETEAGTAITISTPLLSSGKDQPREESYRCVLGWQFHDLLIEGGIYEITFDINSPSPERLSLSFQTLYSLHGKELGVSADIKAEALKVNTPLFESASAPIKGRVKIVLDLNANTYSLTMDEDGKVIDAPLPHFPPTTKGKLSFTTFRIRAAAITLGESAPLLTLSNVRIEATELPEQKPKTIITFIGDSITHGAGTKGGSFTTRLTPLWDRSLYHIRNLGVSGTTLSRKGNAPYWKTSQFQRAVLPKSAAYFVMLGTNDSKPQNLVHKATLKEEMLALIAHLKEHSPEATVFIGIPPPIYKTNFAISEESLAQLRPLIQQAAEEAGAKIIDFQIGLKDHPEWFPDGVHPNGEGHAEMARMIHDAFVSNGIITTPPQ